MDLRNNTKGALGSDGTEFAFFAIAIALAFISFMFFNTLNAAESTKLMDLDRSSFMATQELTTFVQMNLKYSSDEILPGSSFINDLALETDFTILDATNEYFSISDSVRKLNLKNALKYSAKTFFQQAKVDSISVNKVRSIYVIKQKNNEKEDEINKLVLLGDGVGEVYSKIEMPYYNSVSGENLWFYYTK